MPRGSAMWCSPLQSLQIDVGRLALLANKRRVLNRKSRSNFPTVLWECTLEELLRIGHATVVAGDPDALSDPLFQRKAQFIKDRSDEKGHLLGRKYWT